MAWDDTQTGTDSITYTEWNNMVTYIKALPTEDTTDHTALSNIGTNTHAQIDGHLTNVIAHTTSDGTTHSQVNTNTVNIALNVTDIAANALAIALAETDIALNNAKVTNATHSGEVTGATTLTIADNVIDEANMKISNGPTNDYVLTADSGATGGWKWAAASGGGYTNLTEFVDQTAWRVFYSNTDGDITELALGADGTFLKSNGATSAPTFAVPTGSGDVSKVGTPVDNQIGVWTGDGTIEGTSGLTYDGTDLTVTGNISVTGTVDGVDVASRDHDAVTLAGQDFLSLSGQQITAAAIDLDNLSASGTPSSSTFLRGDNSWATPAGSGDVSKVGTPVDSQIGVWTGDGTIEGTSGLTYDGTDLLTAGRAKFTCSEADGTSAFQIDAGPSSLTNSPIMVISVPTSGLQKAFHCGVSGAAYSFAAFENNVGGTSKPGFALGDGTGSRDTNLYRDSANVLKTDDTLSVDGNIIVTGTVDGVDIASRDHDPVTLAGEDFLTLSGQEITAVAINLDNLSATGTTNSTTYLRGDNTWATVSGSGDVSKVGTPVDNQVGVWTGDGTIEGDSSLTYNGSGGTLTVEADVVIGDASTGKLHISNQVASGQPDIWTDDDKIFRITNNGTGSNGASLQLKDSGQDFLFSFEGRGGFRYWSRVSSGPKFVVDDNGNVTTVGTVDGIDIAARDHDAVTVSDTSEIDLTLSGQQISGAIVSGSIDETKLDTSVNASLDLADSAMQDLVDDTTPQLGGNLDLNSKGVLIAGQTVGGSDGDLVYLSAADTWAQADASAEATCDSALGIRLSAATVLAYGVWTTTGLTAGAVYYVSETSGAITTTAPTTSTSIVRIVGYAISTTELFVIPDGTFVENA